MAVIIFFKTGDTGRVFGFIINVVEGDGDVQYVEKREVKENKMANILIGIMIVALLLIAILLDTTYV